MEIKKAKLWATGNGYVISIPKQLIECGILKKGDLLQVSLTKVDKEQAKKIENAICEFLSQDFIAEVI